MLSTIASSSLSWTGSNKFSIIGFSLGAPISIQFITAFPWLIEGVVLLGPAGLLRSLPLSYQKIRFAPQPLELGDPNMKPMVEDCLGVDTSCPMQQRLSKSSSRPDASSSMSDKASNGLQSLDMGALKQWQYEFNEGHVYAFYDTVRHGPSVGQDALYKKFGELLSVGPQSQTALGVDKVLIVFGKDDDVVVGSETTKDMLKLFTFEKVEVRYVPGTHDFVYPNSKTISDLIFETWSL